MKNVLIFKTIGKSLEKVKWNTNEDLRTFLDVIIYTDI
jgi:hypothetical protein